MKRRFQVFVGTLLLVLHCNLGWGVEKKSEVFFMDWMAEAFARSERAENHAKTFEEQFINSVCALDKALWGAALMAQAHHETSLFRKRNLYRIGVRKLDQAVDAEKSNIRIRLTRAAVTSLLPSVAGRSEITTQDFIELMAEAKDNQEMETALRFEIFLRSGSWFLRQGDNSQARLALSQAKKSVNTVKRGEERLMPLLDAAKSGSLR